MKLVKSDVEDDPDIPLFWTLKSLKDIKDSLNDKGYSISLPTISAILSKSDYCLQTKKNRYKEMTDENRVKQFEYINQVVKAALENNNPVISIDSNKKGNSYTKKGQEYRTNDNPIDIVGFSVYSINQWWLKTGRAIYRDASELTIIEDVCGSNIAVLNLWKFEIQRLSNELNMPITVCYFPPGISKWNKIKQKQVFAITTNRRSRSIVYREVIIKLISAATSNSGLNIYSELNINSYERESKISDLNLSNLNITYHAFDSEINYTIYPFTFDTKV